MDNQKNELATIDNDENGLAMELTGKKTMFSSMQSVTPADKAILFKAMNNPEHRIKAEVNLTVKVKDLFCEMVDLVDPDTGELTTVPRIVLVDEKGEGHVAVSIGIFNAVKKLIQVYGTPTWTPPIPLVFRQISKSADRTVLTFDVKD